LKKIEIGIGDESKSPILVLNETWVRKFISKKYHFLLKISIFHIKL